MTNTRLDYFKIIKQSTLVKLRNLEKISEKQFMRCNFLANVFITRKTTKPHHTYLFVPKITPKQYL